MSDRTFKVTSPPMKGSDVKAWQQTVIKEFNHLKIPGCPMKVDGIYGPHTRSHTAQLLVARGILVKAMEKGVTPELRTKIRDRELTAGEKKRFHSVAREKYRKELRKRWKPAKVHTPVTRILADSWGYHPGVHDGVDVITGPDPVIFAMVAAKVIDVRASGWWGNNPTGDVSKGDGIIQLEVLETVGPFKKGQHIGYGHAEKAMVRVGQVVRAGAPIGHAGFANAWHIHLMVNDGQVGTRGVGTRDPRPHLDYAVKNSA